LVVGISVAQETATPEWLKKIDRNGDGKISREEMPKVFDQIDTDKDGVATVAEVTAHFAKTQGKAPAAPSNPPANPNEPSARGALPDTVEKRAVTIWSDGTRMAGDLYLPKNRQEGEKLPAIVFCAGTGGTKGGTGGRLGPIFAEKGYVALAFDYRGWGESESQLMAVDPQPKPDEAGELSIKVKALRWQMNYTDQTEDIRAAISFLAGEPTVDAQRIGLMGSSYGGGLVIYMAGTDPRVKCVVAQVPGLGGANRDRALAAAFRLHTQQARGEVEPVPLETGKMTGKMERYSNMRTNPAKSIGFSALEAAAKINVPALFVVAENEELSNNDIVAEAQKEIAARGVPSKYHVVKGITHYGIYREGFEEATALEIAWFEEHLTGAMQGHVGLASRQSATGETPVPPAGTALGSNPGYQVMLPGLLMTHKGDRPAMANSVETRFPFLDLDFVEFCARLGPEFKLRGLRRDKEILRRYAGGFLPPEIAQRPKSIFRARYSGSFLKPEPPFAAQLLSEESLKKTGYFDAKEVHRIRDRLRRYPSSLPPHMGWEVSFVGVLATQMWHHLFLGGGLCELDPWTP
jgi:dienelactone hydrolase